MDTNSGYRALSSDPKFLLFLTAERGFELFSSSQSLLQPFRALP